MIRTKVGPTLVAVVLSVASLAEAQTAVDISILDRGKPVTNTDISSILDAGKTLVGTTGSTGTVNVTSTSAGFSDGDRVEVWVKRCEDGEVEVILAPPGEDDPCADEEAEAGEECGCDRIGFFIWGDGPVTIDVGTGTVTQGSPISGLAGNRWTVGIGLDYRQMLNLEDVLQEVPGGSDASATGWAPGVQILAEYNYRRLFAIGLDAGFSRMETELRFPAGLQTGDLDYYEAGINAKIGVPTTGRIWPYATVALHRTWNKADFEIDGLSDHRVHKTRRDGIGAGLDYYPRYNWGLRLEGLYSSTFEDLDADEHIRWKFAFLYGLGRAQAYTQDRGGLYE